MKAIVSITVLMAALLAGGCQVLPWMVASFSPPKKVAAVYQLPKDQKVLVLVENKPGLQTQDMVKYELADRISKKLVEHKIALSTVSSEQVQLLSSTQPGFRSLPISEVGKKLGADLVVYVQVDNVSLKDNASESLWHGRLAASVWVVEVKEQKRLWPTDLPEGMGYSAAPVDLKSADNPSTVYADTVIRDLTEKMSDNVSKLFYEYSEPQDGVQDMPPSEMPN